MTKHALFLPILAALASGCVHMTSISTTSVPVDREHRVEAEAERFMFMWMNFDNDYVYQLTEDLAEQCPDGRVEGILTKQERIIYFPVVAHAVRVSAGGFCVKPVVEEAPMGPEPVKSEVAPDAGETGESDPEVPDADGAKE